MEYKPYIGELNCLRQIHCSASTFIVKQSPREIKSKFVTENLPSGTLNARKGTESKKPI